jgi:hypothetical protein
MEGSDATAALSEHLVPKSDDWGTFSSVLRLGHNVKVRRPPTQSDGLDPLNSRSNPTLH